jgi:hypothetical protein
MFQLMPALSIFDAAESVKRLDVEAIQGYMTMHSLRGVAAGGPDGAVAGRAGQCPRR